MAINLNRFDKLIEFLAPIAGGMFSCLETGRRFEITDPPDDGWYSVRAESDTVELGPPDLIELDEFIHTLPMIQGYLCGNHIVPQSFDEAKRKWGFYESIPINFTEKIGNYNDPSLVAAQCVVWNKEKLVFFHCMNMFAYAATQDLRSRFESAEGLDGLKGITPEMRYAYILCRLNRNTAEVRGEANRAELLNKSDKKRILDKYNNSLSGRLKNVITEAGGHLIRFSEHGQRLVVDWSVGGETFNSVVRRDFAVQELGYCASGDDKRHSMKSAVLLARDYQRDGLIYKTRDTE